MTDRDALVDAAAGLLLAAITMRDLMDAMPPTVRANMPADIKGRIDRHTYQSAFDALPADIRQEARSIVDRDPDVIAARLL
jgi:hypothetical protein